MDQVQAPQYYASYQTGTYAYAKVAMFADYALYEMYDRNATKTLEKIRGIVNYAARVFQPLNIHVSLVYAEVWSHGDPFNIPNSSATANYDLQKFARRFMKLVQCDHVSVLSGVRFEDVETIGGRAQMEQICKESGTSIVTGKLTLVDVAGTVFAHELGHSIGLRHDEDYPGCSCPYRTGCIMGAKTSTGVGKMYFSTCSVAHLQQILMSTARYNCMSRPPTAVDTAARCGNGVLEAGEQCDCGISVTCRVGCCDYSTCQAKAGVQCADGECCDLKTCSLRSPGAVCRGAKDICDLPEFCDGQNNRCPADYYMKNGTPCARFTRNYCFEGKCGDREKACKETWGEQAVRTDQCLSLNLHGSQGANCGFFPKVKYCNKHSYVCGRLYCSPNIKNFVAPPGMVSLVIQGQNCVGTVPANKFVTEDKGLVPSGASCGKDAMCISGDCYSVQKVREFYPQCNPPNCNNAGYCNSAGNCHCNKGYGGTGCNQRGPGGSVNSGPSSLENYDILKTIRTTTSRTTVQHNVQKNAQGTAAPPNLQYGGGYQKTAQPAGGYGQRSYYEHYYNQLYKYYNQYSGYNAYQNAYTARTMQTLSGQTQGKLNYNQRYGMSSSKLKNRGGGMNWPFNFNQIGPNEITIIAGVCLIAVIFFLMFKTKSKNVPVKEKVYYSEDRGTYDAPDDARYYSTRYEEVYDEPRREDYCGRQRQSAAPAKAYRAKRVVLGGSEAPDAFYDEINPF